MVPQISHVAQTSPASVSRSSRQQFPRSQSSRPVLWLSSHVVQPCCPAMLACVWTCATSSTTTPSAHPRNIQSHSKTIFRTPATSCPMSRPRIVTIKPSQASAFWSCGWQIIQSPARWLTKRLMPRSWSTRTSMRAFCELKMVGAWHLPAVQRSTRSDRDAGRATSEPSGDSPSARPDTTPLAQHMLSCIHPSRLCQLKRLWTPAIFQAHLGSKVTCLWVVHAELAPSQHL